MLIVDIKGFFFYLVVENGQLLDVSADITCITAGLSTVDGSHYAR